MGVKFVSGYSLALNLARNIKYVQVGQSAIFLLASSLSNQTLMHSALDEPV